MVGSQIIQHEHGAVIRRVDGCAVHAVMVGRQIIRHENGAANDQRVEGRAFHPTQDAVMVGSQIIRHENGAVIRRVDGSAVHAVMVGSQIIRHDHVAGNHQHSPDNSAYMHLPTKRIRRGHRTVITQQRQREEQLFERMAVARAARHQRCRFAVKHHEVGFEA